jgi:hypothetical protein
MRLPLGAPAENSDRVLVSEGKGEAQRQRVIAEQRQRQSSKRLTQTIALVHTGRAKPNGQLVG